MDPSSPSRCYKLNRAGDVDEHGEIVDEARRERFRRAVGDDRAADVDRESQVELAELLLGRARALRGAA
jgi:hypothetical protein